MQPPPSAPSVEVEPWADALDELDPRELAMNRFRTRNEMLEEVFGPEPISALLCFATNDTDQVKLTSQKVYRLVTAMRGLDWGWMERH